jgi:hypothetical protein
MTRCGSLITIYRHHCRDILSSRWRCKGAVHDDSIPCTPVPIISAEARLLAVTIPISLHRMTAIIYVYFRFVRYLAALFVSPAKIDRRGKRVLKDFPRVRRSDHPHSLLCFPRCDRTFCTSYYILYQIMEARGRLANKREVIS